MCYSNEITALLKPVGLNPWIGVDPGILEGRGGGGVIEKAGP